MERNGISHNTEIVGAVHGVGRGRPQYAIAASSVLEFGDLTGVSVNDRSLGDRAVVRRPTRQWQSFLMQDRPPAHQARVTIEILPRLMRILPR